MGSGGDSSLCSKCQAAEVVCQVCKMTSHLLPLCPSIYTECKRKECHGIRKLMISGTDKNISRMFLKCQYSTCGSFEWLDDVIRDGKEVGGSCSTPK
ncbi:hypothetical protein BVC80_213g8 [Macleaya cordata]|uniref:Zinc finger protein n=1 Tax=Macleaya cordata TaxID=56857 RepID=A0A200PUU0_MACCD|nr:hypothetical protein BVC80_213g8 [Macleaya cordata]